MSDISPRVSRGRLCRARRRRARRAPGQEVPAGERPERPRLRAARWRRRWRTTSSCSNCSPTPPTRDARDPPRVTSTTTPARGCRAKPRSRRRGARARPRTTTAPRRPASASAPLPDTVDLRRAWHTVAGPGTYRLVRRLGGRGLGAALASRQGGPAADRRAAFGPPRLDGGEGDRPARGVPLDVPRGGRHEPEGRASKSCASSAPCSSPNCLGTGLAAGTPEAYYRVGEARRIMAYFNLGDDSATDRTAHFAEWRKWLAESGPVAVLIELDRHITRAGLDTFDAGSVTAATPPRCSATDPTTSCCARAGARTGATAATRG